MNAPAGSGRIAAVSPPAAGIPLFRAEHIGSLLRPPALLAEREDPDDLRRRIDAAARLVPLERLALSPQCGFASTAPGNPLSPDEQQRKLELVVDVARRVWG